MITFLYFSLRAVQAKVLMARSRSALFNTQLYTQNLEHLYFRMWKKKQSQQPPDHLTEAWDPLLFLEEQVGYHFLNDCTGKGKVLPKLLWSTCLSQICTFFLKDDSAVNDCAFCWKWKMILASSWWGCRHLLGRRWRGGGSCCEKNENLC